MPHIIQPGKPPQLKAPWNRVFTCDKCGCQFGLIYGVDTAPQYRQGEDRPANADPGEWQAPCPATYANRRCPGTGVAVDHSAAKTWQPDTETQRRYVEAHTVESAPRVLPLNQQYGR